MNTFGTVISSSMIQNMLETDANEAFDLISFNLLFHVFLVGMIPSYMVSLVSLNNLSVKNEIKSKFYVLFALLIVTSSSIYITLKDVSFIGREYRNLRYYINPIFPISSVYKTFKSNTILNNGPLKKLYSDSYIIENSNISEKHTVLVIVVGETARASNFNINGYARQTTPLLNSLDIINYPKTSSCGTATAESLPCMFSDITHSNFDIKKIRSRENLLDALTYADINVLWKDNNSGCKGVCARSETEVMHLINDPALCKDNECHDEILLKNLSAYIRKTDKDTVIVLHQLGSHGPAYYKRTPEKYAKFQPTCKSKALQECTNDEIKNSYDNTIYYTDYLLSRLINTLKTNSNIADTAMIYMSDHGESLGESGIYLHGLPYFMAPKEQTNIPFIVWLSDNTKSNKSIDYACLEKQSQKPHSHDNLIHSVLGLMNIQTHMYNQDLDIFSSCRAKKSNIASNKSNAIFIDKS